MMIDNDHSPEGLEQWSQQLERELKDARQIASKYEDRYFATRELLNVSTERAETLERELAAANERAKRLEDWCERMANTLQGAGWKTRAQNEFRKYREATR
jgi:hypothetical protein